MVQGFDDLFDYSNSSNAGSSSAPSSPVSTELSSAEGVPLAERLRPTKLHDFVGQTRVIGQGTPLRQLLESDQIPSLLLWGPPGSGKSTLARIIGQQTRREFISLHATESGAKAIREVGEAARERRRYHSRLTIVFIDEIHRLNRAQQDVLLPYVESGDFSLIGATTENPSFSLVGALLSRCRIIVFERLTQDSLQGLLQRAQDALHFQAEKIATPEVWSYLMAASDGDGRKFLNFVEELVMFQTESETASDPASVSVLTLDQVQNLLSTGLLSHSRTGDDRYDLLSAFIKSLRGSDPDAALYYLARMIEAGEDPKVIARRMIVLASEDVGNADPRAITIAVSGLQALEAIGLPEAAINLAQVVVYLAAAPKSNRSYMGLKHAQALVTETGKLPIPKAILNAPTRMMKEMGYSEGYRYAHNGPKGWQPLQFLPDEVKDRKLYEPSDIGFEKNIAAHLEWIKTPGEPTKK